VSESRRYRYLPDYFKSRFGERVQKLSIDGGFTCPNRDGRVGKEGCIFCNNESFTPAYCRLEKDVTSQIEAGVRFFDHKYSGQKYLAYFQSYSGTYAPLPRLKQLYEEALSHPKIVGIVVATRPDAVSDEVLDYLQQLAESYYVCVEYGVESANDEVLETINRGHNFASSENTIRATAGRGIHIGAHLIFGLPHESSASMLEGIEKLSALPIDILKLHQLQIVKNTHLAKMFEESPKDIPLYTADEYLNFVVESIRRMRPDVYLERFVNQSPPDYLIAPDWGIKNYEFTNKLDKILKERNVMQGELWLDRK
jgi:radical SAM protein (TIGR01212 family)